MPTVHASMQRKLVADPSLADGSLSERSGPRCWSQRVRVGFRELARKPCATRLHGGLKPPHGRRYRHRTLAGLFWYTTGSCAGAASSARRRARSSARTGLRWSAPTAGRRASSTSSRRPSDAGRVLRGGARAPRGDRGEAHGGRADGHSPAPPRRLRRWSPMTFPPCPRCGGPVTRTMVTGPTEITAGPCGCPLSQSEERALASGTSFGSSGGRSRNAVSGVPEPDGTSRLTLMSGLVFRLCMAITSQTEPSGVDR